MQDTPTTNSNVSANIACSETWENGKIDSQWVKWPIVNPINLVCISGVFKGDSEEDFVSIVNCLWSKKFFDSMRKCFRISFERQNCISKVHKNLFILSHWVFVSIACAGNQFVPWKYEFLCLRVPSAQQLQIYGA